MRLENENNIFEDILFYMRISECILAIITSLLFIGSRIRSIVLVLMEVLLLIASALLIIYIISRHPSRNIKNKYLKEIGQKENARIVKYGERRVVESPVYHYNIYYIEINFKNRLIRIDGIKYNEAYCLLKNLLSCYPGNQDGIAIDIYTYENKIYADIENIDLTKTEAYLYQKEIDEKHKRMW